MRVICRIAVLTCLSRVVLCGPVNAAEVSEAVRESAAAAETFLNGLDKGQRDRTMFTFDDAERENGHYIPKERRGLPIKDMSPEQQDAAFSLVRSTLSVEGVSKTEDIIFLEGYLADKEARPDFRDDEKYYFTIFGKPDRSGTWGWRLEGHHLSVNAAFLGGARISVTPTFMGANPAEVRGGARKGLRVLAEEEEDLARELAVMLQRSGHSDVVFSAKPPQEILSKASRKAKPLEEVGVRAEDMPADAQEVLFKLINVYTARNRIECAEVDLQRMDEAGFGTIHFGWAGSLERGEAFYYRIQGPTFLMEVANVQNKANHIHTVWRDFKGDFGRDLLAEHLQNHMH
ncbi:MAG: DUF3500 domain-containing protein [Pontiella sp.]